MKNVRKPLIFQRLAVTMLLMLLCTFVSGCAPGLPPPEESISSPELGGQSVENTVDLGEPAVGTGRYYFFEDGILNVRILSEDIVASYEFYHNHYNPDENPRFKSLVPLYEDIPQDQMAEKIEIEGSTFVEYDWQVFAHRLSEVKYNLKVHHSLEQEIDRIILRILSIDDVIPAYSEMFYDQHVKWLNPEIFEQFVRENVSIEIIGEDSETDYSDLTSGLSWQVYSGG
ncbi:MAG: hypothetical protein AAGU75_20045, partial [Bacillota bacterium]